MPPSRLALGFLINPYSGGGQGKQVHRFLPEILTSFGYPPGSWLAELTEPDRMEQQAERMLQSVQRLIAVGGDGTIGMTLAVARRLQENPPEIGLIPLGTGNDLARALGIWDTYWENGILACARRLIRARPVPFDLWRADPGRSLAAFFSLGLDAAVLHDFDTARRSGCLRGGAVGNKAYYLGSFFRHAQHRIGRGARLHLETRGNRETVSLAGEACCLVANIGSYAGGASPFPKTDFGDGKLDILVTPDARDFTRLTGFTRLFPRFIHRLGGRTRFYQAERVVIEGIADECLQLDGEDLTGKLPGGRMEISLDRKLPLLDLRQAPFVIF